MKEARRKRAVLRLFQKRKISRAWRSAKRSGEPLRGKHGKGELGRRHDACALTNRPRKRSECIQEKHPVVFQKLGHFRCPGEGQRRTPAACVTGLMGAWQMQGKSESWPELSFFFFGIRQSRRRRAVKERRRRSVARAPARPSGAASARPPARPWGGDRSQRGAGQMHGKR